MGLGLTALGTLVPSHGSATWVAVAALLLVAQHEIRFPGQARWPGANRQVPRAVLGRFGRTTGMAQFGLEMGTGLRTYMTAGTPVLVGLYLLVWNGHPWSALLGGVAFGVSRGAVPATRVLSGDADAWDALMHRLGVAGVFPVAGAVAAALVLAGFSLRHVV